MISVIAATLMLGVAPGPTETQPAPVIQTPRLMAQGPGARTSPPYPPAPPFLPVTPPPPRAAPPPSGAWQPRGEAGTRPRTDLAALIGDADYPPSALRAKEQGIVGFILDVGPNGRVAGCRITRSSGSAALDSTTCRIMLARARFIPARGPAGTPIADKYGGQVDWRINRPLDQPIAPSPLVQEMGSDASALPGVAPGAAGRQPAPVVEIPPLMIQVPPGRTSPPPIRPVDRTVQVAPPAPPPPPPPSGTTRARSRYNLASLIDVGDYPAAALRANEQGTVTFRLRIEPNGRVGACTITRSSGSAALDSTTCRIMQLRARFIPARDSAGQAVPDTFSGRIDWRITSPLDLPFAPLLMAEEMRSDSAGVVTCFSRANAEPPVAKPCPGGTTGLQLAAFARGQGKPLALATVTKLIPEGQAEPADIPGLGDLFRASDAMLKIAADGSILECRVVRGQWYGGGNTGVPPSPCLDWHPGMEVYQPAAEGSPPRIVKLTVRGYAKH